MKGIKISFVIMLSVLCLASNGFSYQTSSNTTTYHTTQVVMPNNFKVGEQYYEGNISGLRQYMEYSVKSKNTGAYEALDSHLKQLEGKQMTSMIIGWGGVAAGAVLAIGGVTFLADETEDEFGLKTYNMNMVYAGLGTMTVGYFAGMLLAPSRKDMMGFVNHHNEVNSAFPLEWRLGMQITPEKQMLMLTCMF